MDRKDENTGFVCEFCHAEVYPLVNGSYRNHCPRCLFSKHVDDSLGDRASHCRRSFLLRRAISLPPLHLLRASASTTRSVSATCIRGVIHVYLDTPGENEGPF